ncbi:MAG: polyribonucleotide nucleotidyltransferase [Candidatus Delongbacteria bacterium]|nr:polyribonucleotide nucleotidyltransferase [Candidatus Delongbacteria bacterium]
MQTVRMMLRDKVLEIETGRMAKQASGSVVVRYGDTMVLVTAVAKKEKTESLDFFPLTVDFREKAYAAGKIPGGYIKREGPPSGKEILSSRQIDRPIRPLFPDGYNHEVQIIAYVISSDQENDGDVLGICGASAALCISEIPFQGPIAGVRVGRIDNRFVINPTYSELGQSEMDIVVAGSEDSLVMVEGGSREISQELLVEAMQYGHEHIKQIIAMQKELIALVGKPKRPFEKNEVPEELEQIIRRDYTDRIHAGNIIRDKEERQSVLDALQQEALDALAEAYPDQEGAIKYVLHEIEKAHLRRLILEEKIRVDGRSLDEIRPISVEVGVLPRTHGSALFTRGQTQSLGVVTLGSKMDEQRLDNLEGESFKSYMLHYNFPPFSVGEVRPMRSPGRREIGHGNLAERAIAPVIPTDEIFPYTIRIVSDILESNGSSSMATVCSGSLSLMDAGVPIKTAVAGIAMGLIKQDSQYSILTDILGAEDHLGDMDFKVCGTANGITAFQMDIKIKGITFEIIREAIAKAQQARMIILEKMNAVLAKPRAELSVYAPRILTTKIPADKIGEVIGSGGKTIRLIQEETGAEISIDPDGTVHVVSINKDGAAKAIEIVESIGFPPEVGSIKKGKVIKLFPFGAVLAFDFNREGLLHISEIDHKRVEEVTDYFKEGDEVEVKVIDIDNGGKIKLSRKALLPKPPRPPQSQPQRERDGN